MTVDDLQRWLADNRKVSYSRVTRPEFRCPDGFAVSIQASAAHYCSPRSDDAPEGYRSVELGFPSERVEAFMPHVDDKDADQTRTVYGWVPLALVAEVLTAHGA